MGQTGIRRERDERRRPHATREEGVDVPLSVSELLDARRPHRADAARNFDAILVAARGLFPTRGTDVPMAEIAKHAGVGAATLYRHFPTREDLAEAVYVAEVDALCRRGEQLAATRAPGEALDEWLRGFVLYMTAKNVLLSALDRDSGTFLACKAALYESGGPLLAAAQAERSARDDVTIDDVMRFIVGVTNAPAASERQRDLILDLAIDAVRPREGAQPSS